MHPQRPTFVLLWTFLPTILYLPCLALCAAMPDSSPFDWNDDDDDNNNFEMADLGAPGLGEDDADNA